MCSYITSELQSSLHVPLDSLDALMGAPVHRRGSFRGVVLAQHGRTVPHIHFRFIVYDENKNEITNLTRNSTV